jgi:hypothetical protein
LFQIVQRVAGLTSRRAWIMFAPAERAARSHRSAAELDPHTAWLVLLTPIQEGKTMLFTIAVILLVLWLLGLVSGYTLGNFIYVLLVIALVLFVVGLVSGRRTV